MQAGISSVVSSRLVSLDPERCQLVMLPKTVDSANPDGMAWFERSTPGQAGLLRKER